MEFYERLRNLRNCTNKSIEQVANDTGISIDNLKRYESNEIDPDIVSLKKLAKYYEVSLDYLLGGEEEKGIYISNDEYLEFMNFKSSICDIDIQLECLEIKYSLQMRDKMKKKFNENLKYLRKKNYMDLKEVANDLSIAYDNIARYERGECEPDIATLILLAKYYSVSVDYLVGNDSVEVYISEQQYKNIQDNMKSLDLMYKTLKNIEKRNAKDKWEMEKWNLMRY